MRYFALIVFVLAVITGCKKEQNETPNLGLEYYPIAVNQFKIYEVDCLVYNDFTLKTDTYYFQLKDVIESELNSSNPSNKEYRVERFSKASAQLPWIIQKAWVAEKSNFRVVEQMDNKREVKLVFPVKEGVSWDGNAENINPSEEYWFENTGDTLVDNKTYSNVFRVHQLYQTDPLQINTQIAFEHYAPGVGLIHKFERYVKRFTTGIPGDPVIDSGFQKSVRLLQYGQN